MVTKRSGQALTELAVGLLAMTLVISALCSFAAYIVKSLEMQNSLRVGSSSQHSSVDVSDLGSRYLFGKGSLDIREKVEMPPMIIIK